ncbi:MAG: hypothetical protein OEZ39_04830 [Gammaproteobacteria bacterium]|nr:hypothetical protein [Gammaproteobacteria bacterium]MDH5651183.1 hypothetical protein [Gammaproteobacteria bacterium]
MVAVAGSIQQKPGWIISRGQDLVWFQGSVIAGLALLALFLSLPELNSSNYSAGHAAVLVLLLWGVFIDGTHVWATYARTYFAPDEQSKAGLPGSLAWGLLLVGPAIALVDYATLNPGPSILGHAGLLFRLFLAFAYMWAFYHLVRQHYGFMCLYRRKAGEYEGRLDTWLLWGGSIYPYLRFTLSDGYLKSGLPHPVPVEWFEQARTALDVGFAAFLLVWLAFWIKRQRTRPTQWGPKHMLLFIVLGFQALVFATLENLFAITATLTIFHNFQYHRIVWQYEKGHQRVPMGNVVLYLGLGALFGLMWYGPRFMGVAIVDSDLLRNILLGLGWGVAFHHYFVDSKIWRIRRTPEVTRTLDAGAH